MLKDYEFYGWLMFFLCGLLFMIPSILDRDFFGFLIGFMWLIGCLIFIFAIHQKKKS